MKLLSYLSVSPPLMAAHSTYAKCGSLLDFEAQKLRSGESVNFCSSFKDQISQFTQFGFHFFGIASKLLFHLGILIDFQAF